MGPLLPTVLLSSIVNFLLPWFKEVEVALLKRRELREWIDQHWDELGDDVSREDWQKLEDISEFL